MTDDNEHINDLIYSLCVSMPVLDFAQVKKELEQLAPGHNLTKSAIRGRWRRRKKKQKNTPVYGIQATSIADPDDKEEIIQGAKREWQKTLKYYAKKNSQHINLSESTVSLVFLGDVHAGGHGVNYERLFADAEIIARTPGMYVVVVGDLVDQFILPSMGSIRFGTSITIKEEWVIVAEFLRLVAEKVIVMVAGNHDNWTLRMAGVDMLEEVMSKFGKPLYAQNDCFFRLTVNDSAGWNFRVRHNWRGKSILNPTHGIERAANKDHRFDVGVGAHTHQGSVVRQFNTTNHRLGYAVLCGTYKLVDDFADRIGFDSGLLNPTPVLAFTDRGTVISFETLEDAAIYQTSVLGGYE